MLSKYMPLSKRSKQLLRRQFLSTLLLCALPAAAQLNTSPPLQVRPLTHNGYRRPYLVYRPQHLPTHPAVVFMLGGVTSTAQSAANDYNWIRLADRYQFIAVFPNPVRTDTTLPEDSGNNITFWEMQGSRTHILAPGAKPVDDDGYLLAVLHEVLRSDDPDHNRIFFAGFSSGSGMVQLFASCHPTELSAIVAVATPLMDPPVRLARPVPVLYIHGDKDEQFSGFQTNSPDFATTPHGNWVTWGYLNGCEKQTAEKTGWGVRLSWQGCKDHVPVIADFVANLGHEWAGSFDSNTNHQPRPNHPLDFTEMAWQFFAALQPQ